MLTCEPTIMQYTARTDVSVILVDVDCLRKVVGGRTDVVDRFTELVQPRRERAEEARTFMSENDQAITIQDLVQRLDQVFKGHTG